MNSTIHALRVTVQREFSRLRADRLTHWLMLWLPLIGCVLLVWMFEKRSVTDLPVVLVDHDNSAQSRGLARAIDTTPAVRITEQLTNLQQAGSRIRSGHAYAVVEIPENFARELLRGEQPAIVLSVNGQALTAANSIARDVQTVVLTTAATFSAGLRMQQGAPKYAAAAATQTIRAELHPLFNPGIDYAAYLAIALVTATLHSFVLIHAVMSVGTERRDRTVAQWAAAAHGSVLISLLGKLLPSLLWWIAFGLAVMFGTYAVLGLPAPGSTLALSGGFALLVTAYVGMGATMALWFSQLRIAASAASLIAAPAVAFSGLTFPLAAMPLGARLAGEVLPLTHFLHLQVAQLSMQVPAAFSRPQLLWLAGFTTIFAALALTGMHRCLRRETNVRPSA